MGTGRSFANSGAGHVPTHGGKFCNGCLELLRGHPKAEQRLDPVRSRADTSRAVAAARRVLLANYLAGGGDVAPCLHHSRVQELTYEYVSNKDVAESLQRANFGKFKGEENPIYPVWATFSRVPIHLQDARALFSIASIIGKPLQVDERTLKAEYLNTARVLVEVDLSRPLQEEVKIRIGENIHSLPVDFEVRPKFCLHCRKLGHDCSHRNQSEHHSGIFPTQGDTTSKGKKVCTENAEGWTLVRSKKKTGSNMPRGGPFKQPSKVWRQVGVRHQVPSQLSSGPGECSNHMGLLTCQGNDKKVSNSSQITSTHTPILTKDPVLDMDIEVNQKARPDFLAIIPWEPSEALSMHRGSVELHEEDESSESEFDELDMTHDLVIHSDGESHRDARSNIEPLPTLTPILKREAMNLPRSSVKKVSFDTSPVASRLRIGFNKGFSAVQNKIWVLWNEENMRLTEVQEEDQAISCRFIDISTNKAITITTVYGQHTREGRKLLWETLAFHMPLDECWLVGGDFNAIASPLEHKGSSSPCASSMADMADCIQACELSEPQVKGSLFTWMGKRSTGTVHRKLDRILLNVNFQNLFDDITTTILSRATSDHKPLILECKSSVFLGPKPFRYLNFWGYHKDFQDVVSKAWGSFGWEAGGGMRGLACKLHNLKPILRDWSYVTFGDIFKNLDEAEQQAEETVKKFEIDSSEENRIAMSLANARLILARKKESQFWFQKANVKWLKEGDASTKYFHSLVKGRQKKNLISKIKKEDGTYTSHTEEIGNTFLSHFQNLLGMEYNSIPESTLVNIPTLITAEDNSLLVELPEEEEIREAVWALNPNSSAGPDGYNGQFFRQAWHIIRVDVIKACQEFFLGFPVPKAFGSTQIILIPKKEGAAAIGNYRPISLSTFMSKIITKILANRLSRLLPKIISSEQAGFQKGKGVEEQILLTNELVHSIENNSRGGNVIVKLDMEKAFDKLSWNYLWAVLGRFGFDISAVNLLMSNLEGTFMSVKVNGFSKGFFQMKRGVKQGDPLSPLLFIIATEGFSRSIKATIDSKFLMPFKVGKTPVVSHLSFADDLILFVNGDVRNLLRLRKLIEKYAYDSGETINKGKCRFYCSKSVVLNKVLRMEAALGISKGTLPFKYLGSHIGKGKLKKCDCEPLLTHITGYIDSWYNKLLNPMGRLLLIKHVLSCIPMHIMAVQDVPLSILRHIQNLMANFFWGNKNGKNKYHWVKWEELCKDRKSGGLGLRSMENIQKAFSLKLLWKYMRGGSLWATFMYKRYNRQGDFTAKAIDSPI
ncbi:unnamed protein product [Cuscuta campestris]|uniref:Reverse transcriptase domain-containing protein n=1 Tax=Cuscuta campestris TaxID=132261 RepID=A0A484NJK9_9ASTE|nr:unnamed protein product [Cuscuta campestris]